MLCFELWKVFRENEKTETLTLIGFFEGEFTDLASTFLVREYDASSSGRERELGLLYAYIEKHLSLLGLGF